MPHFEASSVAGKKRKRTAENSSKKSSKSAKAKGIDQSDSESQTREDEILQLEYDISQSRKHYNNIAQLLGIANSLEDTKESAGIAAIALCRTFCRLFAAGSFEKSKGAPESEIMVVKWLEERYHEYVELLLGQIRDGSSVERTSAVTMVMRLVKHEVDSQGESLWTKGTFSRLLRILATQSEDSEVPIGEFLQKFFLKYDDVRYYSLALLPSELSEALASNTDEHDVASHALAILSALVDPPENDDEIISFLAKKPGNRSSLAITRNGHKKKAQEAWAAVLRLDLSKQQRKQFLGMMVHQVVPWFNKVERLMDFLTDSYNVGGETSLLALAGLFYLIQEKNLDYPSFFEKLYSLLDDGLLLSKHRSRFFRLLDTFMASTHLPAALSASFIKRLSRLALHAPPAGIVVAIPWIYNMFKRHPACTFMIHKVSRSSATEKDYEQQGASDLFDMEELDPMETGAIDSSVWELVALQSHYHPNVATLARIISEQFTKQSYNLEDFLDHSYSSLLEAELGKESKKTPVVEYQIPKTIFMTEAGEVGQFGVLLQQVTVVSGD